MNQPPNVKANIRIKTKIIRIITNSQIMRIKKMKLRSIRQNEGIWTVSNYEFKIIKNKWWIIITY